MRLLVCPCGRFLLLLDEIRSGRLNMYVGKHVSAFLAAGRNEKINEIDGA